MVCGRWSGLQTIRTDGERVRPSVSSTTHRDIGAVTGGWRVGGGEYREGGGGERAGR